MAINVTPSGSRGRNRPPRLMRRMMGWMMRTGHRLGMRRMDDIPVVLLTTRGARSGEPRTTPVMAFPAGDSSWLVVASFAGSRQHPAWFKNMAAHPDQVEIEVDGRKVRVKPRSLAGEERTEAWDRIVARSSRFAGYQEATDREIPVVHLAPS